MNCEEAIKTIEIAKAEVEWNYPLDYQEAFDMAIEALGKQNEIVHCKDCKNWGKSAPDGVLAEAGGICYEAGWLCGEQGFCMYGSEVD